MGKSRNLQILATICHPFPLSQARPLKMQTLRVANGSLLTAKTSAREGAGILTLGLGMDTPWAPWERQSDTRFPPVLFTLATFMATVAFCSTTVVFHTLLKVLTNNPDTWWSGSGVLFLLTYGTYTFISQTFEAAIMLNILHLIVGIPALTLLPNACRN